MGKRPRVFDFRGTSGAMEDSSSGDIVGDLVGSA